jgi:hypothetical protein
LLLSRVSSMMDCFASRSAAGSLAAAHSIRRRLCSGCAGVVLLRYAVSSATRPLLSGRVWYSGGVPQIARAASDAPMNNRTSHRYCRYLASFARCQDH